MKLFCPKLFWEIIFIFVIENLLLVLKLFNYMQSISFCLIDFEIVPSKRYTVYGLLNSIPHANSWAYESKWNCHVWQNLSLAPCVNGIDLYHD